MADKNNAMKQFLAMMKSGPDDVAGVDLRGLSNFALRPMRLSEMGHVPGGSLDRRSRTRDGRRLDSDTLK